MIVVEFRPDILQFVDGKPVHSAADWQLRRRELLEILQREEYGYMPPAPKEVRGEVTDTVEKCCAGHARLETIRISFDTPKGEFSFPVKFFCPVKEGKYPLFLLINFRPDAYDMYFPAEEIIDNGFALAMIYYNDITTDDGDMANGLSGCYARTNPDTDWGKLGMWAWGMSRALDYFVTRPEIDTDNIAVIGHSRLGKTALWCGATDERVKFTFANDSGCGGSALEQTKHEGGETIEVMNRVFPFWFCGNRQQYANHIDQMPFDQHFLVGAIAPRYVALGGAQQDVWADPYSEQLCCIAASPAWEICGKQGFVGPETFANVGDDFAEGSVGFHYRDGVHFLGRADWLSYMAFFKAHMESR